ncbi:MAG: metal transporter [Phyllobacteriaceae bacterium]|nr:metal transporter [Phyllobacteriaceae bacterium]MBA92903.1 metal transporter [Phyllobacteriaceae bacterium]
MLQNLVAGTIVIALTVVIHTFGLIAVTRVMAWMTARFRMNGRRSRVLAMITVVFGLFAIMTVEVWVWAAAFVLTGSFDDFATALYFSTVTFSTLGYGDVLPHEEWRLFTALEGVNGFLLIGWSTAYLVAAGMRVGPFKPGEHF